MRRTKMKTAVEPHVYYHTQCPGYQVRRKYINRRGRPKEISKFFAVSRFGSLKAARTRAVWWKRRNIA